MKSSPQKRIDAPHGRTPMNIKYRAWFTDTSLQRLKHIKAIKATIIIVHVYINSLTFMDKRMILSFSCLIIKAGRSLSENRWPDGLWRAVDAARKIADTPPSIGNTYEPRIPSKARSRPCVIERSVRNVVCRSRPPLPCCSSSSKARRKHGDVSTDKMGQAGVKPKLPPDPNARHQNSAIALAGQDPMRPLGALI